MNNQISAIDWINKVLSVNLTDEQINYIQCIEKTNQPLFFKYNNKQIEYTIASITYALYCIYNSLHRYSYSILFLTTDYNQSIFLANIFRHMIDTLPDEYLKRKITTNNKLEFVIDDSYSVKFSSCDNAAPACCGYAMNLIFLENYELYADKDNIIQSAQYTLTTGNSKLIGYTLI